jgi:RNA polymerase sigma-70 factor, ECF subfamily
LHEAVTYVYEQSRRQLRAVAARYVGDDAEDVVQDAFVSALRYGNTFRGDSSPLTWLYRIVTNTSIDHCRRRSRREHAAVGDAHRPVVAERWSPPSGGLRPAFEDALAVRTALRRLTPEQCRVFVMYDVMGHTHVEIARLLAIPLGTSKSRLCEARRRLRRALADA